MLWLTGPVAAPPAVAILASATVSDATALMAAVQTAGLRGAPDVKGAIEGLKRIDNERVTINGWAVDRTASSRQLTIIAFAGGPHALTTVTNGPRKDVAQMFGLSDAAARMFRSRRPSHAIPAKTWSSSRSRLRTPTVNFAPSLAHSAAWRKTLPTAVGREDIASAMCDPYIFLQRVPCASQAAHDRPGGQIENLSGFLVRHAVPPDQADDVALIQRQLSDVLPQLLENDPIFGDDPTVATQQVSR